jgi:hypothetical protein
MTSKMEEVFRKVLSDKDIFDSPYDKNKKESIPKLFEGEKWKELGKLFRAEKEEEFKRKIDGRMHEIENKEREVNRWREERIKRLKERSAWLKGAYNEKPHLLMQLFDNLDWYGFVECKLPSMDAYGKVIERYDLPIVEHFFVDKIKGARFPKNNALEKVLEYVKELYDSHISVEEIAYFVRKLNSLEKYWGVIE